MDTATLQTARDALNYFEGYPDDELENSERDLIAVSRALVGISNAKLDNKTKEVIIARLHDTASVCSICNEPNCEGKVRQLPPMLDTEDVLKAINLDEHFYPEEG